MTERFATALDILDKPDRDLNPAQRAAARDAALVDGLRGLAEAFGKQIEPVRFYANGEINFFITGSEGFGEGRPLRAVWRGDRRAPLPVSRQDRQRPDRRVCPATERLVLHPAAGCREHVGACSRSRPELLAGGARSDRQPQTVMQSVRRSHHGAVFSAMLS